MIRTYPIFILLALSLVACKSKTPESQPAADSASQPTVQTNPAPEPPPPPAIAVPHLAEGKHGDTTATASGLMYIDMVVGKGTPGKVGAKITANYTGKLLNGTTFDSNVDPSFHHVEPFTAQLDEGSLIKGWVEGISTMRVGGKRRLIVPPQLGYGPNGMGAIPPNATLVFDIELLKVE